MASSIYIYESDEVFKKMNNLKDCVPIGSIYTDPIKEQLIVSTALINVPDKPDMSKSRVVLFDNRPTIHTFNTEREFVNASKVFLDTKTSEIIINPHPRWKFWCMTPFKCVVDRIITVNILNGKRMRKINLLHGTYDSMKNRINLVLSTD